MPRITTNQIAMGVGAAGAMVDISSYADLDAGISRSSGRSSEFDDVPAGTFSFVLDNADGRFTPGNTASVLTTTLTEGMSVCWNLGGRLVAGTVRAIRPEFPGDESAWAQVRITCDDMLGDAGRQDLESFPDAMTVAAGQFYLWRLDDAEGSTSALEATTGPGLLPYSLTPVFAPIGPGGWTQGSRFGADPAANLPWDRLCLSGSPATADGLIATLTGYPEIPYPSTGMGCWGFWASFTGVNDAFSIDIQTLPGNPPAPSIGGSRGFGFQWSGGTLSFSWYTGSLSALTTIAVAIGTPHYIAVTVGTTYSAGTWNRNFSVYVDGVLSATATDSLVTTSLTTAERQPAYINIQGYATAGTGNTLLSRVSHTATLAHEEVLLTRTLASLVDAIEYASPSINVDTLPAGMSTSPAAFGEGASSALARLNEIVRTEQGAIYTATSGTLTAPVQKIKLRERTRPTAVTASFDANRELDGAPDFVRDITNMASTVNAVGPETSTAYFDAALTSRVGSANVTETILSTARSDQLGWAQDRSQRGANVQVKLASVTVDAMSTPTDRSAALLALLPGDRVQITNLPTAQLGFSTWDGWLLGIDEQHSLTQHTFEMHFQPVLPRTGIFDTDRFMADGALTLSAAISSAVATSMSVATTGPKLETALVPYDLLLDSEQVTITACDSATPQVATIVRGVNGTTATTHTTACAIELATPALSAF